MIRLPRSGGGTRACPAWGGASCRNSPVPAWPSRTTTTCREHRISAGTRMVPTGSICRNGFRLIRPICQAVDRRSAAPHSRAPLMQRDGKDYGRAEIASVWITFMGGGDSIRPRHSSRKAQRPARPNQLGLQARQIDYRRHLHTAMPGIDHQMSCFSRCSRISSASASGASKPGRISVEVSSGSSSSSSSASARMIRHAQTWSCAWDGAGAAATPGCPPE